MDVIGSIRSSPSSGPIEIVDPIGLKVTLTWYLIVAEQLESAAKKNGFASYEEYTNVVDNISIVLAGFDPVTKKYIGSEALIRAQIAQVQADKNMPAEDKTEALDELNNALKSPAPPVENKGNIDLVAAYYDKLADTMGNNQQ